MLTAAWDGKPRGVGMGALPGISWQAIPLQSFCNARLHIWNNMWKIHSFKLDLNKDHQISFFVNKTDH